MKLTLAFTLLCLVLGTSTRAEIGGITGGGGGVTEPKPVSEEAVRATLADGQKLLLQTYLNRLQMNWMKAREKGEAAADGDFLFNRADDVFSYLAKALIELKRGAPCLDSEGREVDGSTDLARPGTICLSSFTLGKKLNRFNLDSEVTALVLHEIVHQMGGDEVLAVRIQAAAVGDLYAMNAEKAKELVGNLGSPLQQLNHSLDDLLFDLSLGKNRQRKDSYREPNMIFNNFLWQFDHREVLPFRAAEWDFFRGQQMKLSILMLYVNAVEPIDDKEIPFDKMKAYLSGFKNEDEISVGEWWNNKTGRRWSWPAQDIVMVSKVTNVAGWASELEELIAEVKKADALQQQMKNLPPFVITEI